MNKVAAADVVIFGGGVAGLWILNRLRQAGFSALLFESNALGGGQTHKSQGIIHGGMKYALQGVMTDEARALSDMPQRWRDCISGKGELDLSGVRVLSPRHYLWSPHKYTAKLTGFLAGATLSSQVLPLAHHDYPALFQHAAFKGEVFALDEMVIDVPSLVRELAKINQDVIFKIEPLSEEELHWDETGHLIGATVYMAGQALNVEAQQYIFAAGAGNALMIHQLEKQEKAKKTVQMQRRPLHMVLAKVPHEWQCYAHCLSLGSRPRVTITTHPLQDGGAVWYLGGLLAEEGVGKDGATQVAAAKRECRDLFPWLDFSQVEWASFVIDRAEPLQKGLMKPEHAYHQAIQNVNIVWPVKLALAPRLAADVLTHFQAIQLSPKWFDARELRAWPMPPLAVPVWEELFCKMTMS